MFSLGQQEHWSSESLRDPSWWKLHLDKYCLQVSVQQWKLTVTGRFYCCSKILTPSALCGQSVLFCTKDSGLGHVTYFGEWNMAEGTMYAFWAEILRDITVSANSLTLLYSTMRRIFPRYPLLLQWGSWNESYMKQTCPTKPYLNYRSLSRTGCLLYNADIWELFVKQHCFSKRMTNTMTQHSRISWLATTDNCFQVSIYKRNTTY